MDSGIIKLEDPIELMPKRLYAEDFVKWWMIHGQKTKSSSVGEDPKVVYIPQGIKVSKSFEK